MNVLREREHHIIVERQLKDSPTTLKRLAEQYGISRELVRQIEVRALAKLQKR
jgi:RNA polymerase sigma-32 factor